VNGKISIRKTQEDDFNTILKLYRRQGIGKRMIMATIEWFRGNGIKCIEVDVHSANKSAIGFLEGSGFEENSKRMRLEV